MRRLFRILGIGLGAFLVVLVLLVFAVRLSIGVGERLEGPNHGADAPAYLAEAEKAPAPLDLRHRLLLIGDAGLYREADPTLEALAAWSGSKAPSHVIFLGDNLYDRGLRDEDRERGERILRQQLEAGPAQKIFVPGNHDWGFGPDDNSADAIANQQRFVDGYDGARAAFLPKDGCMGPAVRVLAQGEPAVVAILIDPTHLLFPMVPSHCPHEEDREVFLRSLGEALERHAGDHVVVATHYPLKTGGPHGGLSHGFIGDTILSLLAARFGTLGDTYEEPYAAWIEETRALFQKHPPLLFAAGHDHSLQVFEDPDVRGAMIVSGAGAPDRVSTVTHLEGTRFAHAHPGFMVLDSGLREGRPAAVLRVIENGRSEPVYERDLLPGS